MPMLTAEPIAAGAAGAAAPAKSAPQRRPLSAALPAGVSSAPAGPLPAGLSATEVAFVAPLFGFEALRRFRLVRSAEGGPMCWLESLDRSDVCFCLLEPFAVGLDPDLAIAPDDLADIDARTPADIAVFTIVVLEKDPQQSRTNLRAPVLINTAAGKAKQVILHDPALPIRFYLREIAAVRARSGRI